MQGAIRMTKKEMKTFINPLIEEKNRIMNQTEHVIDAEMALSPDDLADEVDLASSELNQSMTIRLRDRDRTLLLKIEAALAKIEAGTFGTCEGCEEPIEPKRLKARPVATLCINCKEAEERDEKVYGQAG